LIYTGLQGPAPLPQGWLEPPLDRRGYQASTCKLVHSLPGGRDTVCGGLIAPALDGVRYPPQVRTHLPNALG